MIRPADHISWCQRRRSRYWLSNTPAKTKPMTHDTSGISHVTAYPLSCPAGPPPGREGAAWNPAAAAADDYRMSPRVYLRRKTLSTAKPCPPEWDTARVAMPHPKPLRA